MTTTAPHRVTAPSHRQFRSRTLAVGAAVLAALVVWIARWRCSA
jgi:hypothetical protein